MDISIKGAARLAALAGLVYLPGAQALTIATDTTYASGDQYINENIDIASGATLTVEPGAVLHFGSGYRLNVLDGGRLIVQSDGVSPAVFTSDTQAVNSWGGITVYGERADSSGVQINNAVIEYANNAIRFDQGAKGDILNTTVRYNNHGIDFYGKRSGGTVSGSAITDNGYGVYIYANFAYKVDHPQVTVSGNSLYNNSSYNLYATYFYDRDDISYDATGNWWGTTDLKAIADKIYDRVDNPSWGPSVDFSGILTSEGGSATSDTLYTEFVTQDTTWSATNGKMAQPITVSNGATLTLTAGAHIEAMDSGELIVDPGAKLVIQGVSGNPVTLTHSAMLKGSWNGIHVKGERADSLDVQIDYGIVEYANYAVRFEQGSKGDIRHSELRYSNRGVFYDGMRTGGLVENTQLHDNQYGVYINGAFSYKADHPTPVVISSSLYDNSSYNYYGIYYYDRDQTTLVATGNWWGSSDLATVAASIYDNYDNSGWSPVVDYSGLLTSMGGVPIAKTLYTASITGDTTWSTTDGLITQPLTVNAGATLTLAAGVNVEVTAGGELIIADGGRLIVNGTAQSPVTFTGESQTVGSWKGITVKGERADATGVQLSNSIVEYATSGVKFEQGAKGDIVDSILRNNTYGVQYKGMRTGGSITGSQLYGNQYGVYIDAAFAYLADHPTPVVTGNSFHDNSSYNYYGLYYNDRDKTILNATGNWWGTTDLVQVAAKIYDNVDNTSWSPVIDFSGLLTSEFGAPTTDTLYTTNINGNVTWSAANGVMVQPLTINAGATLTVGPGASTTAVQNGELIVADGGKLNVAGTSASPAVFTGPSATAGSWKGITVKGERAGAADVQLANGVVEYATYGVKFEQGAKADVLSSTLRNNTYALYYNGFRTGGVVDDANIYNNQYGIYINGAFAHLADHPKPVLSNSSLYGNSSYNYYVIFYYENTQTTLSATNNWWGSSDPTAIAATIYDQQESPGWSPTVDFSQMLQAEGGAPVPGTHLIGSINTKTLWQFNDGLVLSDVSVEDGAELIIEPDTRLEFASGTGITIKKGGSLTVVGQSDKPVTFTSHSTTPVAGNWDGISVQAQSGEVNISNAVIQYADKGIEFSGKLANGVVTQSTIENNNYGVYVYGAGLNLADHPAPVVSGSTISNNGNYDYYSSSFGQADQRTLNATGNDWGTLDSASIALKVYDYSDTTSSPTVNLGTVRAPGQTILSADAGADFIAFGTVNASLDAANSTTSEGAIVSYHWQQYAGAPVTLVQADSMVANFTADDPQSEDRLSFLLTVITDGGLTATDSVDVTLKPYSQFNQPPLVPEQAAILVAGGTDVLADLTATDADNDPLTYQWAQVQGPPTSLNSTTTGVLSLSTPVVDENTLLVYRLTVSDGQYNIVRDVQVAVKQKTTAAGTYYYHNDQLGTPQVMTDQNADIVWQASYTPFGKATVSVSTVVNNLRFPGQYYDQETGFHYNWHRFYDPQLGRYTASDPIGLKDGPSTYGYAHQNPLMNTDVRGLSIDPDPDAGWGPFAPWLVGTWVHQQFDSYAKGLGYSVNNTHFGMFGSFRPDVFDPENQLIWELKPRSCESNPGNNNAKKQIQKYLNTANANEIVNGGIPSWSRGNSNVLFPNGNVTLRSNYNGAIYDITFYPDSNSETGLVFYRVALVKSLGDRVSEQLKNALCRCEDNTLPFSKTPATLPVPTPLPIPIP